MTQQTTQDFFLVYQDTNGNRHYRAWNDSSRTGMILFPSASEDGAMIVPMDRLSIPHPDTGEDMNLVGWSTTQD